MEVQEESAPANVSPQERRAGQARTRRPLDDYELRGEPARAALADAASRIPTDSALPELAQAEAVSKSSNPQLG